MQVYESIQAATLTGPTYLTIGNFDGVHRGHKVLIAAMCAAARDANAACGLLTFHPHPRSVLRPHQPVVSLTSLYERLSLFGETSLDFVVVHPFTQETAQTEAEDFLKLLHGHLGAVMLWVGPDFALGRGRRGTVDFLRQHTEVEAYPEYRWEGQAVRSSRIRALVESGNVEWASTFLGRFYQVPGIVVHGQRRGHTIGFPTANLSLAQGRVFPANGVYATWAWLGGQRYPSVTNVGVRPTVNGSGRTVEAHIIDYEGDVYGRCLRLEFVRRLRDEMKFPNVDALREQIRRDRDRAAALLFSEPQVTSYARFEELPHTADWAIRVFGADQAELYANAALAMYALQGSIDASGPTVEQFVEVAGADREDLLVRWLSALLWHTETRQLLCQHTTITGIGDTWLKAVVTGRQTRSEMAHIKAVTYHDLIVEAPVSPEDLWMATVVFDT